MGNYCILVTVRSKGKERLDDLNSGYLGTPTDTEQPRRNVRHFTYSPSSASHSCLSKLDKNKEGAKKKKPLLPFKLTMAINIELNAT